MKMLEQIKILLKVDKYYLFLYFYFLVMPWNFFKGQMGVLTVILLFWWLIKFRKDILSRLKEMISFKPLLILIIYILYTYLASLWSDPIKDGFMYVNKFYKYYLLLIPILFTSIDKEKAILIIKIFLTSFFVYSLFSLGIYFDFYSIKDSSSGNPKGLMAYAIVSLYMSIAVVWAIIFAFYKEDKLIKTSLILVSIISLLSLFVNKSRTAQLSLILCLLVLSLINYKSFFKRKKYLFVIPVFIIFISLGYSLFDNRISNKYNNAVNEAKNVFVNNNYDGSFGVRLYFYKAGFEVIKDNFFFGMGPVDNKLKLYELQKNDENYKHKKLYTSYHSQHLDILTAYGFIGYFLIFLSCILLLYSLKNIKKYYYIALSFFLIVFFNSLANVVLIKKPFNYIFISIFVLLSIISFFEEKRKETI